MSEGICEIGLILSLVPIAIYLMKPHTMKKIKCCKKQKKVEPESRLKDGVPAEDNSVSTKLNRLIQGSLNGYYTIVNLALFASLIVIHLFQYRIFMGGFLRNAGLNEVMALFILLVSFKMYN